MSDNTNNNKRIAKNTAYLYFRTIIIMMVTLYTSRVILNILGIEDYGVYNAVGGVVSMFSLLTAALSAAISRFITFELGKNGNNVDRLRTIFSTSVFIQFFLGFIILILGEVLGVWFLNTYMNIPADRVVAANWVWQCCLLSFIIGLISVPYNALIIAHEHMNAYAIVSILDAFLRLVICYLLVSSPIDKLTTYAILQLFVALIIRFSYGLYCGKFFEESKLSIKIDKKLSKEMLNFASFSFLNNSVSIFNHQGINLMINMYFGVLFNAAKGVATQVEGAIMQLVNNITVAINPQITKSYASNDKERMFDLICSGSKYAYYLMLLFAMPIFIETEFILKLWLKIVPDYSVLFLRLAFIGAMMKMLGNTGYTACMATGDIKKYSIWITIFGITAFPLTWISYKFGLPVEYAYYSYILAYAMVEVTRLILMKSMLGFPPMRFVRDVLVKAILVTATSSIFPAIVYHYMNQGFARLVLVLILSESCTLASILLIGMKKNERVTTLNLVTKKIFNRISYDRNNRQS